MRCWDETLRSSGSMLEAADAIIVPAIRLMESGLRSAGTGRCETKECARAHQRMGRGAPRFTR